MSVCKAALLLRIFSRFSRTKGYKDIHSRKAAYNMRQPFFAYLLQAEDSTVSFVIDSNALSVSAIASCQCCMEKVSSSI